MSEETNTQVFRKQKWELVPHFLKVWLAVPSIVYDCCAAVMAAGCGAALGYFSQEEAYKYVQALALYWVKFSLVVSIATISAFQLFRSKSYGEHLDKKKNGTTSTTPV